MLRAMLKKGLGRGKLRPMLDCEEEGRREKCIIKWVLSLCCTKGSWRTGSLDEFAVVKDGRWKIWSAGELKRKMRFEDRR